MCVCLRLRRYWHRRSYATLVLDPINPRVHSVSRTLSAPSPLHSCAHSCKTHRSFPHRLVSLSPSGSSSSHRTPCRLTKPFRRGENWTPRCQEQRPCAMCLPDRGRGRGTACTAATRRGARRVWAPSCCSRTSARRLTVWLGAWFPAPPHPFAPLPHTPPSRPKSPGSSKWGCRRAWVHRERHEDDAGAYAAALRQPHLLTRAETWNGRRANWTGPTGISS